MNLIIQQILEQCQVDEVLKYFGARQDHNVEQIALKKLVLFQRMAFGNAFIIFIGSLVSSILLQLLH